MELNNLISTADNGKKSLTSTYFTSDPLCLLLAVPGTDFPMPSVGLVT